VHRLVLPSVFLTGLAVFAGAVALHVSSADAGTEQAAMPSGPQAVPAQLSLGSADLPEKRTVQQIAPGIVLTTIERGVASADGNPAGGPWVIRTLTIDPKVSKGRLAVARGADLGAVGKTTALLQQADALAGISGGFFTPTDKARPGDPMGLAISHGTVISEPTGLGSEVTLLVDSANNKLRVARLRWSATVRNSETGKTVAVDRVNVAPATPASGSPGELTVITPDFGRKTPTGKGPEVVLDRNGCVVKIARTRGTTLGPNQSALQATGADADALSRLATRGCLVVEHQVTDRNRPVKLTESISAMTGRVWLLNEGKVLPPERDLTLWKRHPRSVAGFTWDGKIVLMTIDGRLATSVGTTMVETARVAQELGLRDAINLDGGRSATMAVDGKVVSGFSQQRRVSDALVWLPEA
jgi:exopolysaccharide biosynthesis protein